MRIGILGNGQLARMLALAGKPMGMDFVFYDNNADGCANVLGEAAIGKLDDIEAISNFASSVDVLTFENENIPEIALNALPTDKLNPPSRAILTAQDRLNEKQFLSDLGIGVPDYYPLASIEDLLNALKNHEALIVKTRRNGYDGRGQMIVRDTNDAHSVWQELGEHELIAEQMVSFQREISMIATRAKDGEIRFYPITNNHHSNGILRTSTVLMDDPMQTQAEDYTRRLLEALDYVGVLGFEFFDCEGPDGNQLLANEFAPRVHNTGHWSIDGAATSQFENHLRAVSGLPLGDTSCISPSVMHNIIGEWPAINELFKLNGTHVHDYQKAARPMRKIGHVTICGEENINRHDQILYELI